MNVVAVCRLQMQSHCDVCSGSGQVIDDQVRLTFRLFTTNNSFTGCHFDLLAFALVSLSSLPGAADHQGEEDARGGGAERNVPWTESDLLRRR